MTEGYTEDFNYISNVLFFVFGDNGGSLSGFYMSMCLNYFIRHTEGPP